MLRGIDGKSGGDDKRCADTASQTPVQSRPDPVGRFANRPYDLLVMPDLIGHPGVGGAGECELRVWIPFSRE